jgi:hypothetical protein
MGRNVCRHPTPPSATEFPRRSAMHPTILSYYMLVYVHPCVCVCVYVCVCVCMFVCACVSAPPMCVCVCVCVTFILLVQIPLDGFPDGSTQASTTTPTHRRHKQQQHHPQAPSAQPLQTLHTPAQQPIATTAAPQHPRTQLHQQQRTPHQLPSSNGTTSTMTHSHDQHQQLFQTTEPSSPISSQSSGGPCITSPYLSYVCSPVQTRIAVCAVGQTGVYGY